MRNQESEVLGTYIIENCRDVRMLIFIKFKSFAYEVIIHVVHKITEKHFHKQNVFSKKNTGVLLVFFKHEERYSQTAASY